MLATFGTSLRPTMDLRLLLMSAVLLGATLTLSVTDRPPQCKIKWTFGILCEDVYNRLVRQIKLWQISTSCLYSGEKCSYELVSTSPYLIKAAHTSPKTKTVNELQFLFEQSVLCKVMGDSTLDSSKDPEANRTNYCSLQNLMDGSGLINAEGYTKFSNKWICPGFDIDNCSLSIRIV
ncbi:uncharacterized protein [Eucyclogobius newberryi]|uniref:uncharacterized protein n=1 Tax=Eucyclogobius newberryi TaxID=166745 RepID=UPI003B59964B